MKDKLREYRAHPPVTADMLVLTANEFLARRGAQLVSKRTLRFYTAQDVVPSPMGSPKFARYGYEHLLTLLAARALQDQGMKLDKIKTETSEIARGRFDRIEGLVEVWLGQASMVQGRAMSVRESAAAYGETTEKDAFARLSKVGHASLRIPLTQGCTLEVSDSPSLEAELTKAHKELGKVIEKLGKA